MRFNLRSLALRLPKSLKQSAPVLAAALMAIAMASCALLDDDSGSKPATAAQLEETAATFAQAPELSAAGATTGTLTVMVNQPGAKISPLLYGLMTEEINYSYDGGLYGELIQNRIFEDAPIAPRGGRRGGGRGGRGAAPAGAPAPTPTPAPTPNPRLIPHWSTVDSSGGKGEIAKDSTNPVNTTALKTSLKLSIASVASDGRVGVANDGYWGIPVRPNTKYHASFYAKGSDSFKGPLTVDIETSPGGKILVSGKVPAISAKWQKYQLDLTTGDDVPMTKNTVFVISAASKGDVWFDLVSLFPPTYDNTPNGNRQDLMQLLADMKPSFLRFPGGNYVEGQDLANRWNWKATVGPLEDRPGHESPWRYRSSDGMGLLEFLEWCEDLKIEPVVAVFAGYTLNRQTVSMEALKEYVQDAVDEIDYITGDASTKWGAQRIKDGHPAPFKLNYMEVGNEDNLGAGQATYDARFTAFYDAIKAKNPKIQVISTIPSNVRNFKYTRTPDIVDDHYYRQPQANAGDAHHYDKSERYDRTGPKIFVGEWASQANPRGDTPKMVDALGDAAWMTGFERNADIVVMSCYAPLLVNVNPGGRQWPTNLIGYDALTSFGSPSYYAQKMFNNNLGDVVLPVDLGENATELYASASLVAESGDVIVKFVNRRTSPVKVDFDLQGAAKLGNTAVLETLTGPLDGINTVESPKNIVPQKGAFAFASPKFSRVFPASSVNVLRFKAK